MTEHRNWTEDDTLDDMRCRYQWALDDLLAEVGRVCPGPHKVTQHRDNLPPWCEACGRDYLGHPTGRPATTHRPETTTDAREANPHG